MTDGQTDRLNPLDEHTVGPEPKRTLLVIYNRRLRSTIYSLVLSYSIQSKVDTMQYLTIDIYRAHLCSEMYIM